MATCTDHRWTSKDALESAFRDGMSGRYGLNPAPSTLGGVPV